MDLKGHSATTNHCAASDLAWCFMLTTGLSLGAGRLWALPLSFLMIAAALFAVLCWSVLRHWPANRNFGAANRVTLVRSSLVILLCASAPYADRLNDGIWFYAVLALTALILDGVDGAVARATGSQSAFGARFDMEVDAILILGLCVVVVALDKTGIWVLALGLMRYVFLGASRLWRWLNDPLPDSFRRKTVCVWQLVTLMVAIVPPASPTFASATLLTALTLLAWSFAVDIRWLYQRRFAHVPA